MNGYGPGPKKHSDEHTRIYDQIRAGTVVRPDPTTIPSPVKPRTIPYFFVDKNKRIMPVTDTDLIAALGDRLQVRSIPDPMEPVHPLPTQTVGTVHLGPGKVPEELEWQRPFLDTLTQVVGHEPGIILAHPTPSPHSWGEFMGTDRSITIGGRMLAPDYFKRKYSKNDLSGLGDVTLSVDSGEVRSSEAHEFGHLLAEQEDPIFQAFLKAAPLPKKPRNDPFLLEHGIDYTKWPMDLVAGEAFADMFASSLRKRFPEMTSRSGVESGEYPFTPQFRGRSRQRMMDSLVDKLVGNLSP